MSKRLKTIAAIASAFIPLYCSGNARAVGTSNLTVEVQGLMGASGNICLTIFSRSEGFPSDGTKALKASCFPISQTPFSLTLDGLNAGNYAIALFHDENADGTLNTNLVGVPQEGFGFSNNPSIVSGPPNFSDATFFVAGQNTTIRIGMKYLLRM